MKNRVGQQVKPKPSFAYRPICKVVSSEETKTNMVHCGIDTLHIVEYPNDYSKYVWEHEWPGAFDEIITPQP